MKAIQIDAIMLPGKQEGYVIDHSMNLPVADAIVMLESAIKILKYGRTAQAKLNGFASFDDAPNEYKAAMPVERALEHVTVDMHTLKEQTLPNQ